MRFQAFYRMYGFRKLSHFMSTNVLKEETFFFPYFSSLHYFKPISIVELISKDTSLLKKTKDVVVRNKLRYRGDTIGNYREVNILEAELIKDMRKNCKEFRFPMLEDQKVTIKNKTLLFFNYTTIHKRYTYTSYSLYRYHMFLNAINDLVHEVNEDKTENKFIYIELPDTLIDFAILNKLAKEENLSRIRKMTDYRYFLIIELWKFLNNDPENPSILNKLENQDDITLLLYNNGKVVPFALGVLNKFIKGKQDTKIDNIKTEDDIENTLESLAELLKIPNVNKYKTEADFSSIRVKPIDTIMLKKLFFLLWNNIVSKGTVVEVTEQLANEEANIVEPETVEAPTKDMKDTIQSELDKIIIEDVPQDEDFESENFEVSDDEIDDNQHQIRDAIRNEYKNIDIDGILNNIDQITDEINKKKIEELKDTGIIQKARAKTLIQAIEDDVKIEAPKDVPSLHGKSIREIISKSDGTEAVLNKDQGKFTKTKLVQDETYNKDNVSVFINKYVNDFYRTDMVKVFGQLEKNNFILKNYKMEKKDNILNELEEHELEYKLLNGKDVKIKVILPTIREDGTFKLNKNTYQIRMQRTEVPISKIDNLTVLLNSYYGKLFVTKAGRKAENVGDQLLRKITLNDSITKLVLEELMVYDTDLPTLYEKLIRNIKSFRFLNIDMVFDYNNRYDILDPKDVHAVKQIEDRNKLIFIGRSSDATYYMDANSNILSYKNGKLDPYTKLHEALGISNDFLYSEFVSCKILGKTVPLYLLFSYYIGIENAFKLFNLKYTIVGMKDKGEDNKIIKPNENQYMIKVSDAKIIVDRDYGVGDLVFMGTAKEKNLSKITMDTFNSKENFSVLFSYLDYPLQLKTEIKMLENFFIDPMTKELLKSMGEPTNFVNLLKRASELLVTDRRNNQEDIQLQTIKSVERVNGMLYRELMNSIKDFENKSVFGRNTFSFDPYSVMKKIKDDNTTILQNDLNPNSYLGQRREVTLLGSGGRDILTITNKDRKYNPTYYGTITEHFKDNGDTGINAQLTCNPYIKNVRGLIDIKDRKIEGGGDVYSFSALLKPLADKDDGKRLNFISIQGGHLVPIVGKSTPYLRTGYETVIPLSLGEKFLIAAKDECTVTKVTDKQVAVRYKGEDKDTVYPIKSWTSKEESDTCYNNVMVPNVKVGDKLTKDDTIIYNSSFFIKDIFNPKRVMYIQGTYITTCVCDIPETYNDSSVISKSLTSKLASKTTKVKSIVLDADKDIPFIVKVGDEVKSDDAIMTIVDRGVEDAQLDKETLKILKELKKSSPKAKVNGKIIKVEVYYNGEIKTYSKNVKDIITKSDEVLLKDTGYTGRVDHTYSIKGKPIGENQFEIKIYIESTEQMGVGDKGVFGNQLKSVVGDVYSNEIVTDDGRVVEALFGYDSIQARMVASPYLIGTTCTLLDWVAELAVEAYFGK